MDFAVSKSLSSRHSTASAISALRNSGSRPARALIVSLKSRVRGIGSLPRISGFRSGPGIFFRLEFLWLLPIFRLPALVLDPELFGGGDVLALRGLVSTAEQNHQPGAVIEFSP